MNILPTGIARIEPPGVEITWSDGQRRRYTLKELRDACPCASCRERRTVPAADDPVDLNSLTILSAAEAKPLRIESMRPAGNYAYSIAFSDGHSSGIYTFERLRELGEIVSA